MRFSVLGCYSPFAPYKGACNGYLLENNNKQFSTRIRQNTNNISEIQI